MPHVRLALIFLIEMHTEHELGNLILANWQFCIDKDYICNDCDYYQI